MKISLEHKVNIINYSEKFKEEFKTINYNWIKEYFEITELDKKHFENPKTEIIDKQGFIFLAEYNSEIIGTVALGKVSKKQYLMTKMAVEPGYQGYKIGQSLIEAVIKKCIEIKLDNLILYTNQVLVNAINLYFKNGFKMTQLGSVPYKRSTIKMELKFNT